MKRFLALTLTVLMVGSLFVGCANKNDTADAKNSTSSQNSVDKIIDQAQKMSNVELFKKAIKESKGKTMYGIGNSSRGATAATNFVAKLKSILIMARLSGPNRKTTPSLHYYLLTFKVHNIHIQ